MLIMLLFAGTMCPECKNRGQKYLEECTHITCDCGAQFCYCCGGGRDEVDTADPYSSDINRYLFESKEKEKGRKEKKKKKREIIKRKKREEKILIIINRLYGHNEDWETFTSTRCPMWLSDYCTVYCNWPDDAYKSQKKFHEIKAQKKLIEVKSKTPDTHWDRVMELDKGLGRQVDKFLKKTHAVW